MGPIDDYEDITDVEVQEEIGRRFAAVTHIKHPILLGSGNFSTVFRGVWSGTTSVALKLLKHQEDMNAFAKEATVLRHVQQSTPR